MLIPNSEKEPLQINIKNHTIVEVGTRFNKLQVISEPFVWSARLYRPICYTCLCDCGNHTDVLVMRLRSGRTTSCGCAQLAQRAANGHRTISQAQAKNVKHGYLKGGRRPEYRVWQGILERCLKSKHKSYKDYGGRGIKVCQRWLKFENFIADMGDRPSGRHSIERRDNNGDYEPSNCYWAEKWQQERNSRGNHNITFNGKTQCLTDWAHELGIKQRTLITRLHRGWSVERAFKTNAHRNKQKSIGVLAPMETSKDIV